MSISSSKYIGDYSNTIVEGNRCNTAAVTWVEKIMGKHSRAQSTREYDRIGTDGDTSEATNIL